MASGHAGACLGFAVASALAMTLGVVEDTWQEKVTPALKGLVGGSENNIAEVTPVVEPVKAKKAKEDSEARSEIKTKA